MGVEPMTQGLKVPCSTTELTVYILIVDHVSEKPFCYF